MRNQEEKKQVDNQKDVEMMANDMGLEPTSTPGTGEQPMIMEE